MLIGSGITVTLGSRHVSDSYSQRHMLSLTTGARSIKWYISSRF